jgi:Flp pilus assembly protein TadG
LRYLLAMLLHSSRARINGRTAVIRLARDQSAATAVEFAIVVGPLILLLFGIMEFGRALWLLNALHYASEEAARCASNSTAMCGTSSQIQSFAVSRSGADFQAEAFTVTSAACGNLVTASYPMNLMIPFGSYSVTLQAQSCFAKQKS